MADPLEPPVDLSSRNTPAALFQRAFDSSNRDFAGNRLQALFADSFLNPRGYKGVLTSDAIAPGAKAAYVAGRLANDLIGDGTRIPYWALNHPLAQVSVAGSLASTAAGLQPNYGEWRQLQEAAGESSAQDVIDTEFAKRSGFYHNGEGRGIPLTIARSAIPALASGVMTAAAGNTNYLNILGGGRTPGFQSVMPVEGSWTESSNPLLELGARYLFGRTGRVLPWEAFTAERPEVSEDDYKRYAAYQFDKGPLGIGLVRGTTRNLDGEPEATMLGFRVPLSAAAAAAGSLGGAVAGANIAAGNEALAKHKALAATGPRRLAGAALGGTLGALAGKLGSSLLNNTVIQPTLNPERVAATEAWIAQQQAAGLL